MATIVKTIETASATAVHFSASITSILIKCKPIEGKKSKLVEHSFTAITTYEILFLSVASTHVDNYTVHMFRNVHEMVHYGVRVLVA